MRAVTAWERVSARRHVRRLWLRGGAELVAVVSSDNGRRWEGRATVFRGRMRRCQQGAKPRGRTVWAGVGGEPRSLMIACDAAIERELLEAGAVGDHPSVRRYARTFAANGGGAEDLLQDARVGYARALRAVETGRYDARMSGFDTFATNLVYREMCTANGRRGRTPPTVPFERGSNLEDDRSEDWEPADRTSPPPDRRLLLAELIRELPDDARTCVELALGDGIDFGATARETRRRIREALGFSQRRAAAAFAAVSRMLGELAEV